jgi:hypothetical protein
MPTAPWLLSTKFDCSVDAASTYNGFAVSRPDEPRLVAERPRPTPPAASRWRPSRASRRRDIPAGVLAAALLGVFAGYSVALVNTPAKVASRPAAVQEAAPPIMALNAPTLPQSDAGSSPPALVSAPAERPAEQDSAGLPAALSPDKPQARHSPPHARPAPQRAPRTLRVKGKRHHTPAQQLAARDCGPGLTVCEDAPLPSTDSLGNGPFPDDPPY